MAKRTYHTSMRLNAHCWPLHWPKCTADHPPPPVARCTVLFIPTVMLYRFRQFMPTSPTRRPRLAIIVFYGEPGHRRPHDLIPSSSSSAREPFNDCPFTAAFKSQSGTEAQPWGTKCRLRSLPFDGCECGAKLHARGLMAPEKNVRFLVRQAQGMHCTSCVVSLFRP